MSLHSDWLEAVPFREPVPSWTFPYLALLLFIGGFLAAANFGVQSTKASFAKEISAAVPSSLLLGFGTLFLFLAAGIYV
ncbi:uncharacterized protein VTP21DRAFT_7925 [Calcarisporiella thermophila]|uniref:uncharacterized protein n=1 Tax=Calcarisporiella thermophila TaxID=911321 RepID=UPI003741ED82